MRFRAWHNTRAQEEAALIARLQSHRARTALGVKKADALSANSPASASPLQSSRIKQTACNPFSNPLRTPPIFSNL